MNHADKIIQALETEKTAQQLNWLYGAGEAVLESQKARYAALIRRHAEIFGERADLQLVSAPGRTEIGGNHTDHNNGRVLAAAVNLDALCAATPREDLLVPVRSFRPAGGRGHYKGTDPWRGSGYAAERLPDRRL